MNDNIRKEFIHAVERTSIALYRLRDLMMRANNLSAMDDAMVDFATAVTQVQNCYEIWKPDL